MEAFMAKKNLLMVDDDKDLANSVKAYFEARGYEVRTANSGNEGMKEIERKTPDIILLDIMMDYDADGFNLAYKLKCDKSFSKIPIVILSGFTDHLKDKSKSFEFIMDRDWPALEEIRKPASLSHIGEVVERVLA
jgi:DNA-binding response OmpR family regulator